MVDSSHVSPFNRTLNRREFLTLAGTTVALTSWSLAAHAQPCGPYESSRVSDIGPPGEAKRRIDGLSKVTGEKIYARDFHAWDMPGWPQEPKEQSELLILRATYADRPFLGIDLSLLDESIRPYRIITGSELQGDVIAQTPVTSRDVHLELLRFHRGGATPDHACIELPKDIQYPLIVPEGETPNYLGQAVAFLLFENRKLFRRAKRGSVRRRYGN